MILLKENYVFFQGQEIKSLKYFNLVIWTCNVWWIEQGPGQNKPVFDITTENHLNTSAYFLPRRKCAA